MDMYKFGNTICRLREEKQLTQAELAAQIGVTDKSISKWENGQAFPRMETFEKLASALGTTTEELLGASRDDRNRICIANDGYSVMQIDVDGALYSVRADESCWVEIKTDTVVVKITGELLTEDSFAELNPETAALRDKVALRLLKKAASAASGLILQADCTYEIMGIAPESVLRVEADVFSLGDKTLLCQNFLVCYPKMVCETAGKIELKRAQGKNSPELIKKYKKIGLASDLGVGFLPMLAMYPVRGLYFRHLCKPKVLAENINLAEMHKAKSEKKNGGRKIGCLGSVFLVAALLLGYFLLDTFVFAPAFVSSRKPYLVASDYTVITRGDSVYTRIDALPGQAKETLAAFGATVWEDCRKEGVSRWEQATQENKVKLYEDDEGRAYLWLVENYPDTIFTDTEDRDYEDFSTHYVYVCENPE